MSDERGVLAARKFKFDDPEDAFKQARRRITNNALRRQQRSLDLSDFGLVELPPEIGELSTLTHLELPGNRLSRLPPEFGNLKNLRGLNLSKNTLSLLPIEFGNLGKLRILHLNNNQFVEFPTVLLQLTGIEYLDLSKNELSVLPQQIGEFINLYRLYLSANHFARLPMTIGKLKRLSEFHATDNEIAELPEELLELSNLNTLSLSGNIIRSIPEDIGLLRKLSWLDIESNKIKTLPPSIGNLGALERLHVAKNELISLPPEIGGLNKLTSLLAYNNNLEAIPPEIGLLQNLRTLDVRSNKLRALAPEIGKLENLARLNIDGNLLQNLPEQIGGLGRLRRFTLRNNKITSLPSALGGLALLELLDLENNSLDRLPSALGNARSLGKVSPRPTNPKVRSNTGLYLERNPLPPPFPSLIAPGQPLATLNVLAWLRDEIDMATLPQASSSSERKGHPPEPSTEPGPSFTIVQGRLDLAPGLEQRDFDKITQHALLQRLRRQCELLQNANLKVGNQHPLLVRTIEEYGLLISKPLDEIDVVDVWSVGTSVLAQALAFERQDAHRTISEPLEPAHLALLIEVSRLHGGFILGFPAGLELTARSDAARLAPDVARVIDRPTSDILASMSKQRRLFSERARGLADALEAALLSTSWDAARVGHASYVTVRNLLIETGRMILAANSLTSTVAGGLVFSAAVQQSGLTLEATLQLSEFIKSNTAEILSFVAPFPELRVWVEWMINYFDEEEKRSH
jgi:Leucine-rich repeat (LRR) protein